MKVRRRSRRAGSFGAVRRRASRPFAHSARSVSQPLGRGRQRRAPALEPGAGPLPPAYGPAIAPERTAGAGPPGVVRTSTKWRGLRISRSRPSGYSTAAPASSRDAADSVREVADGVVLESLRDARRDRVRRLEADALLAHQRVGQFGQRGAALTRPRLEPRASNVGGRHGRRDQRDGARASRNIVLHERLQVVLRVHDVAERRVVHRQR